MPAVTRRPVAEQKLLTIDRRLTVEALPGYIGEAARLLAQHLAAGAARLDGPLRVDYHGMVTEDSDGPVEVALPFTGSVEPDGELRVRLQRADWEAVTVLDRRQADYPAALAAYDAVGTWIDAAGLRRAGSPAEVYLTDRDTADARPDEPHVEATWPVADG